MTENLMVATGGVSVREDRRYEGNCTVSEWSGIARHLARV